MRTLDSSIAKCIKKTFTSEIGNLYCFNHIAVVEFNEGVHVNLDSASELLYHLTAYFGKSRPFGLVSNRTNSFSISMVDSGLIKSHIQNLVAYGVVGHTRAGKMNCSIENDFCKTQEVRYHCLYEAVDSVYSKIKEELLLSLS